MSAGELLAEMKERADSIEVLADYQSEVEASRIAKKAIGALEAVLAVSKITPLSEGRLETEFSAGDRQGWNTAIDYVRQTIEKELSR